MRVVTIPQLMDNYGFLVIDAGSRAAAVVDCAEAEPVIEAVERERVALKVVLPTHHHLDHVGGNQEIVSRYAPEVIGYRGHARAIPGCTREVTEGDRVRIGTLEATVLFIPAHTAGHVAYHFEKEQAVFTGDTLFSGGCGRLFEGDAAMMIASLAKLAALPDATQVYFGHEYTEKNLRFALTLEPENAALRTQHTRVLEQQRHRHPTVPTTIGMEKAINPFLRWHSEALRASLRAQFPDLPMTDVAVFAKTRELKDRF